MALVGGAVALALVAVGCNRLLAGLPGDGATPVLVVQNSCDPLGRVYVGLADEGHQPNASLLVEVAAGEDHVVILVHDPDRDPSSDRLDVAIGTDSGALDVVIPASPTERPPTVTVTGSCARGEPCTVEDRAIHCALPPEP